MDIEQYRELIKNIPDDVLNEWYQWVLETYMLPFVYEPMILVNFNSFIKMIQEAKNNQELRETLLECLLQCVDILDAISAQNSSSMTKEINQGLYQRVVYTVGHTHNFLNAIAYRIDDPLALTYISRSLLIFDEERVYTLISPKLKALCKTHHINIYIP